MLRVMVRGNMPRRMQHPTALQPRKTDFPRTQLHVANFFENVS